MDFFTRKLHDFRRLFSSQVQAETKREITRFEGYFHLCYKIFSWEDISLTLTVFLVLNFVFWLVIQLQLKFFGVIFLLALACFIGDCCLENCQQLSEQMTHVAILDDLKTSWMDVMLSLKALRKDNPSSFCIGMSLVFLAVSFVARNMSGYVISYLILLTVFFIPFGISKLPQKYIVSIQDIIKTIGSERGVLAEDELIPFISNKDFGQRDPDQDSLLTDRTADSMTNSLISGLNSMPSHLDADDKESLQEDDLLPQDINKSSTLFPPGDVSSDSDSDHKAIRFESSHFNGDSSSEEEMYTNNLIFSNVDNNDSVNNVMNNVISVATVSDSFAKVANLIKNVVQSPVQRKDSSSDSDFEMINNEEAERP